MSNPTLSLFHIALATLTTLVFIEPVGAEVPPAGQYALESQMILPHLDEMRRLSRHRTVCIEGQDADKFFPVFLQPAFIGCELRAEAGEAAVQHYVLLCDAVNGASGHAHLKQCAGGLRGELKAKMGGKNMTFSQFVTAIYSGPCDVPALSDSPTP